ncbi:MAG: hypothetical protein IKW80_11870, partial [Thermoguttaceae bacterium]|nr:hypothetical protein [Thermoguttaceae bacterium]
HKIEKIEREKAVGSRELRLGEPGCVSSRKRLTRSRGDAEKVREGLKISLRSLRPLRLKILWRTSSAHVECDGLPSLSLQVPTRTTIDIIRANNAGRIVYPKIQIKKVFALLARITFLETLYVFH